MKEQGTNRHDSLEPPGEHGPHEEHETFHLYVTPRMGKSIEMRSLSVVVGD